jgi:Fur family ferric uptake transcriptional regulator
VTTGWQQALKAYLADHGLKGSRQREVIAEVFFKAGGHQSVDTLLQRARQEDPRISQATVYRTMKLLTDCGLAAARHFFDGETRYEKSDPNGEHHDHLICLRCNTIVEFCDPKIEALQETVARRQGFAVTHHKMELYGLCRACQASA